MKKFAILSIIAMGILVSVLLYSPVHVSVAQPRADLDIIWYASPEAAYSALTADDCDFIQWSLTKEQKEAVEADPNLQITSYTENGMFEFDLNNNFSIMDYPGVRSPTNCKEVRQALTHLTNKDYIISDILEFFGSRLDVPMAISGVAGWCDPTVVTWDWNGNGVIDPDEDNFPYPYDPDAAAAKLASAGFSDTDGNGYLNYPSDWEGAPGLDTTEMPLKICIRQMHTHRREAGRLLYAELEGDPTVAGDSALALADWPEGSVGGDFDTTDETWNQPRAVLSPIVMGDRNYHIYTGGWSLGRFPDHMFFLYGSLFWYPNGPNYVCGEVGTHPDLDTYVAGVQYAVTIEAAQEASLLATKYFVEEACNIPLWGYSSYVGWRREIAGIINEDGYGFENDYTFINAYRTDNPDAPLRMACISSWDRLNILYSQWYYERALLDRVSTGFIAANPYALTTDQPWACKDWEKSSWTDPRDGMEKTMLTYWLREDIGCVAPITGELVDYFDAYDYEFTVWYNYAYDDSWLWSGFMDVHHVKIVDDYTVEVYFDDASVWFTYSPTGPLLGPEEVLLDLLCEETSATFTGADLVEDPTDYFEYQFTTDHVVQVTSATVNGEPITVDTDFYIRAGYDTFSHNVFVALTTFNPADEIIINYYTSIAGGAGGSYLGGGLGLDWTDTMYSYGYHYPISISGSSAALNVNPYFHLETPILGEVDWRWIWVGTEKPRSGYYKIEIFDVVKAAAAYCTRGDGIYDPTFFPGSDLDASDLSHVGIYDIVSITGRYGNTFGSAP